MPDLDFDCSKIILSLIYTCFGSHLYFHVDRMDTRWKDAKNVYKQSNISFFTYLYTIFILMFGNQLIAFLHIEYGIPILWLNAAVNDVF